jgi:hypothetical protein
VVDPTGSFLPEIDWLPLLPFFLSLFNSFIQAIFPALPSFPSSSPLTGGVPEDDVQGMAGLRRKPY